MATSSVMLTGAVFKADRNPLKPAETARTMLWRPQADPQSLRHHLGPHSGPVPVPELNIMMGAGSGLWCWEGLKSGSLQEEEAGEAGLPT